MKRPFLYLVYLLALSCGDSPKTTTTTHSAPSSNTGDPTVTTNTDSEREFAEKRYARIEEMDRRGLLRCDSLDYDCGGATGKFMFCKVEEELLRAVHKVTPTSGADFTETYYYDGDERFYAMLSEGSDAVAAQERRYYHGSQLIGQEGEVQGTPLGSDRIRTIAESGSYDCD